MECLIFHLGEEVIDLQKEMFSLSGQKQHKPPQPHIPVSNNFLNPLHNDKVIQGSQHNPRLCTSSLTLL